MNPNMAKWNERKNECRRKKNEIIFIYHRHGNVPLARLPARPPQTRDSHIPFYLNRYTDRPSDRPTKKWNKKKRVSRSFTCIQKGSPSSSSAHFKYLFDYWQKKKWIHREFLYQNKMNGYMQFVHISAFVCVYRFLFFIVFCWCSFIFVFLLLGSCTTPNAPGRQTKEWSVHLKYKIEERQQQQQAYNMWTETNIMIIKTI